MRPAAPPLAGRGWNGGQDCESCAIPRTEGMNEMAKAVKAVEAVKGFTTAAVETFAADRIKRGARPAMEARIAALVWGAWHPADMAQVMAGKSPKAWKGLRDNVARKADNESEVKLWATDVRKLACVLANVSPAALKSDVDNGQGPDADRVAQWLEGLRLACEGATLAAAVATLTDKAEAAGLANPFAVRKAFADRFADANRAYNRTAKEPEAPKEPEITAEGAEGATLPPREPEAPPAAAPATIKVRVRNLAGALTDAARAFALLTDAAGDDKPARADLDAIATALCILAPEAALRKFAALAAEAADLKSAPTPEAEAAAAANESAAAAPAKAPRKRPAA